MAPYDFTAQYDGTSSDPSTQETMREIDERYRLFQEYPEIYADEAEYTL